MKVLHLISSGGMYGAEAVILNLSHALQAAGHASEIAVFENLAAPNHQLRDEAERQGITTHVISCKGQIDLSVVPRIRALLAQTGASVVHAHGYKADIYAWRALGRKRRVGLISTCHTWYDNDIAVRLYGAFDRWVLRSFDAVVAVSEQVQGRLLGAGVSAEKVHIIQNGIDVRRFAASAERRAERLPEARLRVGLVGRLAPEKGVDIFLQSAADVLRAGVAADFEVAGDGPNVGELEQLIAQLGMGGHVRLLGRCEDMAGFFGSLDLLVSASRQEGLPIALLEGMASRLPIVATAVGAVPNVVRDGVTGMLVPPERADLLAAAMKSVLCDAGLRHRLSESAYALVATEYSADRMAADYLRLYESVVVR